MSNPKVDNYTRPEDKVRWGFGGSVDAVEIKTPADAEPVVGVDADPDDKGAHKNGGGKKGAK